MADLKKFTVVSGFVGEAEVGAVVELTPEWGAKLESAGFVQAVPEVKPAPAPVITKAPGGTPAK